MDLVSLKYIGIGLCSLGLMGSSLGVAQIFSSLLKSISRNPSVEKSLVQNALIGAGLAEAMGLFAFLIAILLLFSSN
ncbi:F0F1 ATP synthase subunit C [Lyticum sinuosum]|uniref:ATP synthase subunit c n=1 Tax=Lyticum sinuosum TaxID=1332059 RepID=A0AAE4VL05_9RICK|nr:F0F1 ATP synthase subunit C [Lyticum sinuosum]MDZ5761002.1 ATP synthase subunit c [Lyticum sinuosum]